MHILLDKKLNSDLHKDDDINFYYFNFTVSATSSSTVSLVELVIPVAYPYGFSF